MAVGSLFGASVLFGTGWTGTAPGLPGAQTVSGTISASVDLSAWGKQIATPQKRNMQTTSNFGSNAFDCFVPGMKNMQLTVTLFQDFAAGGPYATINAAMLAGTLCYWDLRVTTAGRTATNPSIVVAGYVTDFDFLSASVGEVPEVPVGFQVTGQWAPLTA